jgi:tRNA-splicing ligase RtcB
MAIAVEKVNDFEYRLPKEGAMRTDGVVFASPQMMRSLSGDPSLEQVRNVATLPGIVGSSFAMPDIHWGYGFPIGGVAGFDAERGVVSPGGVGYDINCGVRLLKTGLDRSEIAAKVRELTAALFASIPTGVGSHHLGHGFSKSDYSEILSKGARWAVERGHGEGEDLN